MTYLLEGGMAHSEAGQFSITPAGAAHLALHSARLQRILDHSARKRAAQASGLHHAMVELRSGLRKRLHAPEADAETARGIAAILDDAARRIAQL